MACILEQVERLPSPLCSSGEVWRMKHIKGGGQCVFKIMCVLFASEQEVEENIKCVRDSWNSAASKGITTLVDCFYDVSTKRFVLATEWMDALSLRDHMRPSEFIPDEVVGAIAAQIVEALAHLHKIAHRAHRDLKPGNILLSTTGQVKITDLGQSKQLMQTFGVMGSYLGTQIYMSPQRIQGGPYTNACDVWALGLIAQECMMGECPYLDVLRSREIDLDNNLGVLEVMQEESPPPLRGHSHEAANFCATATNFSEEGRPSAMELRFHPFIQANRSTDPLIEWIALSLPTIPRCFMEEE